MKYYNIYLFTGQGKGGGRTDPNAKKISEYFKVGKVCGFN